MTWMWLPGRDATCDPSQHRVGEVLKRLRITAAGWSLLTIGGVQQRQFTIVPNERPASLAPSRQHSQHGSAGEASAGMPKRIQ